MIKTQAEIDTIAQGGKLLSQILDEILAAAKTGVTTKELDRIAEKRILEVGGLPAFKGYRDRSEDQPFPTTICASVNEQLVHTPANDYALKTGDMLTVDIGMRYPAKDGYFTDMAKTIVLGEPSALAKKLMSVTRIALEKGIAAARAGNYVADIGRAIQPYVEANGFSVVRSLVGHGVGYAVHEEPRVPNYFNPKLPNVQLEAGMVIAIEPMVNAGSYEITALDDGWSIAAADGQLCAHFEHTVAITKDDPRILTQ